MARLRFSPLAVLALGMASPSLAQTADEGAIRAMVHAEETALNAHDAGAYGAFLESDADAVTPYGQWLHGRDAYVARLGELFAGPGARIRVHAGEVGVRMLSLDIALVHVAWSAEGVGPGGAQTVESQMLRRSGDRWLIASSQETDVATDHPAPAEATTAPPAPPSFAPPRPARKCLLGRPNGDCLIYK